MFRLYFCFLYAVYLLYLNLSMCKNRNLSIFCKFPLKNRNLPKKIPAGFLVETRGVEPLSKKPVPQASPSAVPDFRVSGVPFRNKLPPPIPVRFPQSYRTSLIGILLAGVCPGPQENSGETLADQAAKAKSRFAFIVSHRFTGWMESRLASCDTAAPVETGASPLQMYCTKSQRDCQNHARPNRSAYAGAPPMPSALFTASCTARRTASSAR